ncbi:MAG: hypothetical protein WC188_03240 [Candidatus Caldatribacteriota bacterium]|jgi:hypothetical protein|nr:hypothetical protein [Patescibacteria group bacterium]
MTIELNEKTLYWSDILDKDILQELLSNFNYAHIEEIKLDHNNKCSIITYYRKVTKTLLDHEMILIPDHAIVNTNKSIYIYDRFKFELTQYQKVLDFINNHCSYIVDYLTDKNIKTVELEISEILETTSTTNQIITFCSDHLNRSSWLNNKENHEKLSPLILAAISKKFYSQNENERFYIPLSFRNIIKLNSKFDHIYNSFKENPEILLSLSENISEESLKFEKRFEFLNNNIIECSNKFTIFNQNPDLKYLNLLDKLMITNQEF